MFSFKEAVLFTSSLFVLVIVTSCFCDTQLYVPPNGVIYSPRYPRPYENDTNCMWHIRSREPMATIMLSVEDLDIESDESEVCGFPKNRPCCKHNWLSLPLSGTGKVKTQQVCGHQFVSKPILVRAPEVAVKLHISRVDKGGKGFRLSYKLLKPQDCLQPGMVPCGPRAADGCYHNATQHCDGVTQCVTGRDEADCDTCYTRRQRCDGKPDCQDYSDEVGCGFCEKGKVRCSASGHHCFHPVLERCNGRFDCPWGEDEVGCVPGCKDKIACSGGEGCYSPSQRCDSLSDCLDGSDEALCPPQLCATMRDHRQCHNGHCLPVALWCDGVDDCGDNSDEQTCLKNSVIALAIMGSLFCGLLLVIAVGCAFRFYGHRYSSSSSNYHLHISPHLASRLRMTSSVSMPTLMADELFHREPPPAYSVAVGESEVSVLPVPATRPRRLRRTRLRPVPPPQVVVKPPDSPIPGEASSSQSSPSRDSSSSYLSGTDDTLLLSS
ncbi:low-density lipoprotein receptor-related protein 12-like isoform X1 [Macrosteles quadrilineatus]|uniref:low-density lipoprotein receptor-related protein 12-like isoform X1 n=1 Tax=Macrosteles quadrilineatus TaxID=74068 RepID=UPI0023E2ABDD|nr:low-density lipoprotein receptor-related protein 12-like isoform X1 [Macrosteles quadrilineatus]